MTKAEIIEYLYDNNVRGDLSIEEMAEDLAEDEPQTGGILFKGNLKEGDYKLIKTTDGWVLEGEDIVYCGWESSPKSSQTEPQADDLFTDKYGDVWEWRGDAWYCISGEDEPQTDEDETQGRIYDRLRDYEYDLALDQLKGSEL